MYFLALKSAYKNTSTGSAVTASGDVTNFKRTNRTAGQQGFMVFVVSLLTVSLLRCFLFVLFLKLLSKNITP